MNYDELVLRKDKEIKELEEKNKMLLDTLFKKEKENTELKMIIKRLEKST